MKLTLRIENVEALPDGGPLDYSATDSGFEVGRAPAPGGWKLPDPYVSARHMEIAWAQGAFVLHDLSSNGTYLYGRGGASRRVPSPYRLMQGDRLVVGPYVLRVQIEDTPPARAATAFPADWSAAPPPDRPPPDTPPSAPLQDARPGLPSPPALRLPGPPGARTRRSGPGRPPRSRPPATRPCCRRSAAGPGCRRAVWTGPIRRRLAKRSASACASPPNS